MAANKRHQAAQSDFATPAHRRTRLETQRRSEHHSSIIFVLTRQPTDVNVGDIRSRPILSYVLSWVPELRHPPPNPFRPYTNYQTNTHSSSYSYIIMIYVFPTNDFNCFFSSKQVTQLIAQKKTNTPDSVRIVTLTHPLTYYMAIPHGACKSVCLALEVRTSACKTGCVSSHSQHLFIFVYMQRSGSPSASSLSSIFAQRASRADCGAPDPSV